MVPTKTTNGRTFTNPKTGRLQTKGPGGKFGKYVAHTPEATRSQLVEEQVPHGGVILGGRTTRNNPVLQAIGNQFVRGNPWQFIQNIQATASQSSAENLQLINSRQYYDLCDEMADKDTTIEATLNYIASAIFCRPQAFVVTDELDDQAVEMRDIVERDLTEVDGDFGWESLLYSLLIGFLRHGFSVNETMWGFDEGRIKPLEYLHRHPGKFAFGDRGAMKYADTSGNWQEAPRGKFILARRPALYGNAYGRSALFGMRYVYFFKKQAIKAWVDFADTYGMPLAHGKVPIGANNKEELRDKLINIFESLRGEVGIVTTEDEELDFIERVKGGSGSKPAHAALVEWFSREEVRGLVGAALAMMEAEHGSRAQATTHASVNQTIIKPFSGLLETAINRGLIRPYVNLNFGTDAPAPVWKIDTDDALDVKVAIEALSFAIKANLEVAQREAREMLNLTVPKEGEPVLEKTPEPAPVIVPGGPPPGEPDIPVDDDDDGGSQRFAELPVGTGANLTKEREFTEKMHRLADVIAAEHAEALAPQFAERVAEARLKTVPTNRVTALGAGAFIPGVNEELIQSMENALVTARMFAAQISGELFRNGPAENAKAKKAIEGQGRLDALNRSGEELAELKRMIPVHNAQVAGFATFVDLTDVPPEYHEAIRWAVQRDVMTVADVRQLAEDLHLIDPANSALFFERELRRQVLALAGSTSEQLTVGFGRVLAGATAQGLSFGDFLDAMDEHVNAGTLPGGMEGYLSNVYRTETANAYAVQRESIYDDPDLAEFIWGFEFWNPEDDGSRPSHDDMSGVIVRKGGEAHIESLGGPPWSFACRCSKAPIIAGDPATAGIEETSDALARVRAIERFRD